MFGLLLGYPIVYWYDLDLSINCLAHESLCVTSISAAFDSLPASDLTITSFSYPAQIADKVKRVVDVWRNSLKELSKVVNERGHCHKLRIDQRTETLSAVCL